MTGCCFTDNRDRADFAVIWDIETMPDLSQFKQGTPVYPEDSTTLLIMIGRQELDIPCDNYPVLSGAGINGQIYYGHKSLRFILATMAKKS